MGSLYASLKTLPPGYRFAPTDEELIFYLRCKVLAKSAPGEAVRDINANDLYSRPPHAIVEDPRRERGEWYFFIHHDEYEKKVQQEKENIPIGGNWIVTTSSKKEAFQERKENGSVRNNGNWIGKEFKEKQEKGNFRIIDNGIGIDFNEEQKMFGNWTIRDLKEEGTRKFQMSENRIGKEVQQEKEKIRIVGNGIGFWKSIGKEDPIYDASGNVFAFKIHFIYFSGSIKRGKKTHWRMEEYHLTASGKKGDEQDLKKEEWVLGRITRGRDYT